MYRSSVGIVLVALFATSCASEANGKVEIANESETTSISGVYVEKYPDCDSNEFMITGRIVDGAVTPLFELQGPVLSNDITSTTVTSAGIFTAKATAPSGIESTFALRTGNAVVLMTIKVQGLIEKDCTVFAF